MKSKVIQWERVTWPYNDEKPYCNWECWKTKIPNVGTVILHPGQWPKEGWSYVLSARPDDNSHSGFLKGFTALEDAKVEVVKRLEERR